MNFLFAVFAAIVVNGDFESGKGTDVPGWPLSKEGKKAWSVRPGAGLNGNRGFVWENADPGLYTFPKQEVKLEAGKRYRVEAHITTKVAKNGSGAHGAGVCLEWYDKDGKYIGCCYPPRVRGTNDWAKVENVTKEPIPENAVRFTVAAFVHRGCMGYAAFDDISVTEYEMKPLGGLFSSAYRDVATEGEVKFFAPLFTPGKSFDASSWKVDFTYTAADGARKTVPAKTVTRSFASLPVDCSALAEGRQNIVCTIASADGKIRDEASLAFTRAAKLPERRVYIDSRRRTIVDGKPFFPLGLFSSVLRPPVVRAYADGPFNCILPYHSPSEAQMDHCHAKGIKVIYAVNKTYAGWRAAPKGVKTEADEIAWIENRMAYAKNHPAMLAWYLADELSVTYVPRLAKRRAWLAATDPDHPTFACYNRVDQIREYLPSVDVFGTDIYPVPFNPLRDCADQTLATDEGAFRSRPLWQVPQIFSWGQTHTTMAKGGRFPTRDEMRSMCWQMVASGANGIIGYCLHQIMDRNTGEPIGSRWSDTCAVFGDLKRFSHVFLAGGDAPVAGNVPKNLAVRMFREGRDVWALVCNLEDKTAVTEFGVSGIAGEAKSQVIYGEGVSYAGNGKFKVSVAPFDVCLVHVKEGE